MENSVDLSIFFLMEGSADSETDSSSFDLCKEDDNSGINNNCHGLDDDEDARSCSYKSTRDHCSKGFEVEEEDEVMESFVMYNDSEENECDEVMSREAMDAMEDKGFWEACIAVGYPASGI